MCQMVAHIIFAIIQTLALWLFSQSGEQRNAKPSYHTCQDGCRCSDYISGPNPYYDDSDDDSVDENAPEPTRYVYVSDDEFDIQYTVRGPY